ncbi:hypothetical protein TREMEDRAFT_15754, partial [Tremella mesenterica DSM 1558]|uniref:uncharacterized protein n=1 Tax=Tremella mesenterica (strain ATCC 24925 / CBS 8224 / DSM 1558 / NBRC 9311 / NRRL Y-6157 / RJB 2259-6 / UBC 559-6) TaxID=578456 RepID=UPI0003F48BEA
LQALTPTEEDCLVDYIKHNTLLGQSPTATLVLEVAEELRRNRPLISSSSVPLPSLGRNWIAKFKSRHPTVSSTWTRQMERACFVGTGTDRMIPWFAEVGSLMEKNHYKPSNIFNMDETGFGIGTTQASRVLAVFEGDGIRGKAWKTSPGRQEWVTIIECISADGEALPPMVIFKGNRVDGWHWSYSNKGWSNNTLGYEWLKDVFIPTTSPSTTSSTPNKPSDRRLLILDGHGSHVQACFVTCMQHNIDLVVLPSHSSQDTQPLDIAVFAPYKKVLRDESDKWARRTTSNIPKGSWADSLILARTTAMTSRNIKSGFRE